MTDQQRLFCDIYIKTLSQSEAVKGANYSNSNIHTQFNRLMDKPEIKNYINLALHGKSEKYNVDENKIWEHLSFVLNPGNRVKKVFVIDKKIIEYDVPIDLNVQLKACDMLAKLLGMYDKKDDNFYDIELPD